MPLHHTPALRGSFCSFLYRNLSFIKDSHSQSPFVSGPLDCKFIKCQIFPNINADMRRSANTLNVKARRPILIFRFIKKINWLDD